MAKRNILQEAITDAKAVKEAAYANAESVLMEHLKENVKQFVDSQLNENLDEKCDYQEEGAEHDEPVQETYSEGEGETDMADDYDVEEMPDEEEGEEEEDVTEEGLTEADLEEALQAALSEVTHGGLGDPEFVDVSTEKNPTGIEDLDSKEEGWEEKTAPKAKAHSLATGEQYHQEARAYKAKIAKLVKENVMLKKANEKISEALKETKLFNAKLFYATKLMQKEGLNGQVKASIVKKMDKVGSLSEAKNLFESLELALGVLSERTTKSKKDGRSLTEAYGSRNAASGTGKGVSHVKPLNEEYVTRNQKLAGIIKE